MKKAIKKADLPYKSVYRLKTYEFVKKFLGQSYKNKVAVPIKKTTRSHHRLRTTWILQFLMFVKKWNCKNVISIDESS